MLVGEKTVFVKPKFYYFNFDLHIIS